ncbi:Heavy-metal-associated domain-containing protein [Loktanella fryxellensis]|uniref:Heavy-metal-associated domain-containing protein n=2 Tax=Loktanella fryxellensis TaxID=245187 RepID=A0A1H7ZN65_9RHOB|nr:Heavy-metal-associated domain-containing protein [Loktanella fryxellensis]
MTCASCVARVERALLAVPGVASAALNMATDRAVIATTAAVSDGDLVASVAAAGYAAQVADDRSDATQAHRRQDELAILQRDLTIAAVLTLPVVLLEMGSHLIPAVHDLIMTTIGMRGAWVLQGVLTTLILFWPGLRFYRIGLPALARGAPDMHALVAVGTLAA